MLLRAAVYGCTGCALHNPGGAIYRCNHSPGPAGLTPVNHLLPSLSLVGLALYPRPCLPFFFSLFQGILALNVCLRSEGCLLFRSPSLYTVLGLPAQSSTDPWFPGLSTKSPVGPLTLPHHSRTILNTPG